MIFLVLSLINKYCFITGLEWENNIFLFWENKVCFLIGNQNLKNGMFCVWNTHNNPPKYKEFRFMLLLDKNTQTL